MCGKDNDLFKARRQLFGASLDSYPELPVHFSEKFASRKTLSSNVQLSISNTAGDLICAKPSHRENSNHRFSMKIRYDRKIIEIITKSIAKYAFLKQNDKNRVSILLGCDLLHSIGAIFE